MEDLGSSDDAIALARESMEQAEQKLIKTQKLMGMVNLSPSRQERLRESVILLQQKLDEQREIVRELEQRSISHVNGNGHGTNGYHREPAPVSENGVPPEMFSAGARAADGRRDFSDEEVSAPYLERFAQLFNDEEKPEKPEEGEFSAWQASRRERLSRPSDEAEEQPPSEDAEAELAALVQPDDAPPPEPAESFREDDFLDFLWANGQAESAAEPVVEEQPQREEEPVPLAAAEPDPDPEPEPVVAQAIADAPRPVVRSKGRRKGRLRLQPGPANEEVRRLTAEVSEWKRQRDTERARVEVLLDQLVGLRGELDEQRRAAHQLRQARRAAAGRRGQRLAVQVQRQDLRDQTQRLESALLGTEAGLEALRAENSRLTAQADSQRKEWEERLAYAGMESSRLEQWLAEARLEADKLREAQGQLELEASAARKQVEGLREELAELREDRSQLNDVTARSHREREQLLQENRRLQESQDRLQSCLDDLTVLQSRIFNDFDSLKRERDQTQETLEAQEEQEALLKRRMADLARLRHREAQAQAELMAALAEAKVREKRVESLETEHERLSSELEHRRDECIELQSRVRTLDQLLSHETESGLMLLQQARSLERQVGELERELGERIARDQQGQAEPSQLVLELERSRAELYAQTERSAQLEHERVESRARLQEALSEREQELADSRARLAEALAARSEQAAREQALQERLDQALSPPSSDLEQELADRERQLLDRERKLADVERQLVFERRMRAELEHQQSSQETDGELRSRLEEAEREARRLEEELDVQNRSHQALVDEAADRARELRTRIAELEAERDERSRALEARVAEIEQERGELAQKLEAAATPPDARVKQLEELLTLTENELYHRQRQYVEERDRADALEAEQRKQLDDRSDRQREELRFETSEELTPVALEEEKSP